MEEETIMEEETSTTTAFLPQEVVMDILSRLPANSLVSSFKFVCKAWYTTIKDPAFVKIHLNRGVGDGEGRISSNNNQSLICKSGKKFFQLYPPFNFEDLPPTDEAAKKLDLDLDFDFNSSSLDLDLDFDFNSSSLWIPRLVGSCNGLLCLTHYLKESIILLNPSTRRYKISPIQPIKYLEDSSKIRTYGFSCFYNPTTNTKIGDTYGFGCFYNPTTNIDEYKVVRIVYLIDFHHSGFSPRTHQVDIYCMSSNSWRTETKIRDYVFNISNQKFGVFVNEAFHWVAGFTKGIWDTIASFDIRDEEFRQVPIPLSCHPSTADDDESYINEVILMNIKGCLSMIRFPYGRRRRRRRRRRRSNNEILEEEAADMEIWVMKEYGIRESWTKEFVIKSWDTDPPRTLYDCAIPWSSNAHVLKGDQILIEGSTYTPMVGRSSSTKGFSRKLVLYDINKGKINVDFKMIGVPDEPYPRGDQVDYIETLVSLKSSIMVHALDSNLSSSSS